MNPESGAAAVFLDRLRADPQHLDALMGLGSIALATGARDAARTIFDQATRHHPGALGAWVTLGDMALEDGKAEGARCHYQAALAGDPRSAEAARGGARGALSCFRTRRERAALALARRCPGGGHRGLRRLCGSVPAAAGS